MFKETKDGQTHSYNDGCGAPEHNGMELHKVDYKGKYFILQDELDEECGMDFSIGMITKAQAKDPLFVASHKENCMYYGIPCYIGKDEELNNIYK